MSFQFAYEVFNFTFSLGDAAALFILSTLFELLRRQ